MNGRRNSRGGKEDGSFGNVGGVRGAEASGRSLAPERHNDTYTPDPGQVASNSGAIAFSIVLFAVACLAVLGIWWAASGGIGTVAFIVALVIATILVTSVHIAEQWEKVVVLRLGKFNRVVGPGLFVTIPVIESCAMHVDLRVRTTSFSAEETLTSDLVPLNVDAVMFWMVFDAEKACLEVSDFRLAVERAAQTSSVMP